MIDSLPQKKIPKWLANADAENPSSPFPLKRMLKDSLYYPSSGCSGLIEPDTLIRDNSYQLLRCENGTETNL